MGCTSPIPSGDASDWSSYFLLNMLNPPSHFKSIPYCQNRGTDHIGLYCSVLAQFLAPKNNNEKGKSMNRFLVTLVSGGLVFSAGLNTAVAQDDDDGAAAVEIYTCSYVDGKDAADLDKVIAKWNKWADDQGMTDYSAWTMTPFYASAEQDFDIIWLGVTQTGKGMGVLQDNWIANGGSLWDDFDSIIPCDSHSLMAAVQFKEPPKREDRSSIILDFSDCTIGDGKHFSTDVAPALKAWGEFRAGHGSTAGMWAFFPVYGGGGEEFDFKFVVSHGNYAEQGADFDNYDPAKNREIFPYGMLDCDSSRSYIATNRRMAESDDE